MTVKNLTDGDKETIGTQYKHKLMSQKQLAQAYGVSPRSINRVLHELGLSETLPRMTSAAVQAEKALKAMSLTFDDVPNLLISLQRMSGLIKQTYSIDAATAALGFSVGEHTQAHAVLGHKPTAKVAEDVVVNTLPKPVEAEVKMVSLAPIEQVDVGTPWRVGEYWSSANPNKKVLLLSRGVENIKSDAAHNTFIRWIAGSNITSKPVTKEQVTEFMMNLPEEDFALLHSNIITARVARASNTHVQTTMLNLQNKVEANAKATEQLRKK